MGDPSKTLYSNYLEFLGNRNTRSPNEKTKSAYFGFLESQFDQITALSANASDISSKVDQVGGYQIYE